MSVSIVMEDVNVGIAAAAEDVDVVDSRLQRVAIELECRRLSCNDGE